MSSSTSSSSAELRVVGVVLAVLALCEIGIRAVETSLTLDIRNNRAIPEASRALVEGDGVRILFVGNSLTHAALDVDRFEAATDAAPCAGPVTAVRVTPFNSQLLEWLYAFEHYFVDVGNLPDILVVGFAWEHLQDSEPIRPSRLAAYYSSLSDVPDIFSQDLRSLDSRAEFLLAYFSVSFAQREAVSQRVLSAWVPFYQFTSRRINTALRGLREADVAHQPVSYQRLERLVEVAADHGVRVILVAMPIATPYELDSRLPALGRSLGISFIDMRRFPGLTGDMFTDGLHLDRVGSALYTRALARRLAGPIRSVRRPGLRPPGERCADGG